MASNEGVRAGKAARRKVEVGDEDDELMGIAGDVTRTSVELVEDP